MSPPPFGTPAGEAARALLVLAAFAFIVGGAELWHRRAHPPVEWTRKLVHFAAGLMACGFPWVFSSPWTLLAVAAVGGAPVFLARARGGLPSIFGVDRRSFGDVYFPIAIFVLFAIGRSNRVFYVVSLLTLVVSDALAAVLGRAYGKHAYRVITDQRSLEGSAVFLFATFLLVHLPLLLATHIDRATCVLMAAQIALSKFAGVQLPDSVAGFTWEQIHLVLGIFAGFMAIGWLVTDVSDKGVGFWLEVLGGIGLAVGAVMMQRERHTGAIG
jgi:phytol kinase